MSRLKSTIIGALATVAMLLLGGCSSLRLAYNTAPTLAWWGLDGYVDFSSEQTPQAKAAVDRLFDWHRATQLPEYLPLLASAQAQIGQPTTAAQACRWQGQVREKLEPTLQRAFPSP